MENNSGNTKNGERETQQQNPFLQRGASMGIGQCQHCYCDVGVWNNKKHIVCCICGHRTLANPISY